MVRSSTFARFTAFAVACAAGGCLFPSLDGLSGDAATDLDAALDSHVDAPTADVTNGDAFGVDAGANDGTFDSAAPFCASHAGAVFCADFDENADPSTGFTNTYVADGGIIARDTDASTSPPASLVTGNAPLSAGQFTHGAEVLLSKVSPTTSITLDFDVRVDALATEGTYIEALALVLEASPRSSLQLNLKSASSEVGEELVTADGGTTYIGHTFSTELPMMTWSHVTIALAFAAPRTITVTVDSNVVVDHAPMSAQFAIGTVDLYCGNSYSPGPSSGATIRYDNVLLDVK